MFDSVFCYFPITFHPPPNDPYGITAQDLKIRLRECIAASELFAPYAFPQLIDKLDSASPNVKVSKTDELSKVTVDEEQKDVLQTIAACASSYGLTTISHYSLTIWESLKFELFSVQEGHLTEEALVSLQAVTIRLSRGLESTDLETPLAAYLQPIIKDCIQQLQEPQHKQARPVGQILSMLAMGSPVALCLIVRAVFPPLNTLYQGAESILDQRALLGVVIQMLDSAVAIYGTPNTSPTPTMVENPLKPFKDRLLELTSQALRSTAANEVSFRILAVEALLCLCMLRNYLQNNEIGVIIRHLNEIILTEDLGGKDDLKKGSIKALVELSKFKPHLIMDITFPAFMARLPDSNPSNQWDYLITLEGLAQLSVETFVVETFIRRLLNKLDVVLQNGGSTAYPQAILSALHYVLSQKHLAQAAHPARYHEKIVVGLTNRVVAASVHQTITTALNEENTLERLGRLVTIIVSALDDHKQRSVAAQVYSLFVDEGTFLPVPYRENAPKLQRATMILSTALMAGLKHPVSTCVYPYILQLLIKIQRVLWSFRIPMKARYQI